MTADFYTQQHFLSGLKKSVFVSQSLFHFESKRNIDWEIDTHWFHEGWETGFPRQGVLFTAKNPLAVHNTPFPDSLCVWETPVFLS